VLGICFFTLVGLFLWVAPPLRSLVHSIQACGFLVVSTNRTEHCCNRSAKFITGWPGLLGFSWKNQNELLVEALDLPT